MACVEPYIPNQVVSCAVRFEGKEPEALAFAIMKHDTLWGSTSKAVVQQLRKGHKGRKAVIRMIEGLLLSNEIDEFLEGLDGRREKQHSIYKDGWSRALARLFCFQLPTYRTRYLQTSSSDAFIVVAPCQVSAYFSSSLLVMIGKYKMPRSLGLLDSASVLRLTAACMQCNCMLKDGVLT